MPFQFLKKLNFKKSSETPQHGLSNKVLIKCWTCIKCVGYYLADALFHILCDSYSNMKSVPPQEVLAYSNAWADFEDFLATFLQHYQVTENENDFVSNKQIVDWSKENGFKISSIKIGMEMAKVKGIKKQQTVNGAQYTFLKQQSEFPMLLNNSNEA
jgi:hypothetical protein